MKKNIRFIFILMSVCVAGIMLLQLYYSYSNFTVAQSAFREETENALGEAIDSALVVRNENIVKEFRGWLMDTSYVDITCKWDENKNMPMFTVKELQSIGPNRQNEISMSIEDFEGKVDAMTPEVKEKFVLAMEGVIRNGLKKGIVWFFTQGIGERLSKLKEDEQIDNNVIDQEYKLALKRKGIELPFVLTEEETDESGFCTDMYNIGIKNPEDRQIKACFDNAELYLLKQLKWIIISSLLLIVITLFCFWYTARILLSQQKLSELKDDFISNMTHEIHSPLASVIITAEALKGFDMTKEERDNYIDIILYQSAKLTTLTDDILTGVKLERKGEVTNDEISLKDITLNIICDIKGDVQYTGSDIVFRGDKKHITAALSNLVENAIKYNLDDNPAVEIKGEMKEKEVVIKVSDNGPGIPDEYKKKVFDEFYRIPTGNLHTVKGYGLGLSYVKKVIKAHKGSVEVKNNQPKGSVFIIRIPYEV